MTSSELKEREIRSRESIADKDREQKDKSDKRAARASFYGSAIKSIGSVIGKMNDPAWYKKLTGSTQVNASIPDFQTLGTEDPGIFETENFNVKPNVPAVLALKYIPTIGPGTFRFISSTNIVSMQPYESAINRALNRVATALENRNSRVASYSRDTIGRYLFMVTDIAVEILRIKSIIDLYTMAESNKPFVARQLIRALGFNYQIVKANIANIRSEYNLLAHDFNRGLPIPSDLAFLRRQLWMNHTVIKDMKSEYCSYLVFCKALNFRLITEATATWNVDEFVSEKVDYSGNNVILRIQAIRENMEAIINGATWKPLIRDIRGGTKSQSWFTLPEDATVKTISFVDIDEVRSQVHNLVTLPSFVNGYTDDTANSGVKFHGVAYGSASIGGDTKEAVTQSLYNGSVVSHSNESTSSEFFKHCTPGTMLFQCNTAVLADNVVSNLLLHFPKNGTSAVSKSYVLDSYKSKQEGDGFLVSSRLKLAWRIHKFTYTIVSGNSPVYIECEKGVVSLSAAGTYYFVAIEPVQYGTEIISSMMVVSDASDLDLPYLGECLSNVGLIAKYNETEHDGTVLLSTCYSFDIDNYYSGFFQWLPHMLGIITTYDWHPLVEIAGIYDSEYTFRVYGELDHYTTYLVTEQHKLNEQCIESEFTLSEDVYLKPLAGN